MAQYTAKNAALATVYFDTEGDGSVGDPYRMKQGSAPTTDARLGATDETAAASDSATAGLNGLLKRLLGRITTLLGVLPGALGAGGGIKVDGSGTALPVSGTVSVTGTFWQATQPVSVASSVSVTNAGTFAVQAVCTNAGTFAVQASQSGGWTVDLGATDNAVLDAIAASLAGTLTVGTHAVTQSGTWNIGTLTTLTGITNPVAVTGTFWQATQPVSLASLPALPAGTNNIGDVDIVSLPGYTPHKLVSGASTNATSVVGSAATLGFVYAFNANAAVRYLKLYNKASAPTVGSDTPVLTLPIPPGNSGFMLSKELAFATGIAYALTTGAADADTGAVAAGEIVVNMGHKS